ncbi:LPS export ABC transporter periplasmic protein LptC [Idiomarina sp.]|uniref:LPS export ABC transporter periplasmic protein LptC n=1 Tax=Idiomarina sp. TaxID=1874361 RepID=UPI0026090107|nr:LPS export ABC transporter periplasmic protein LptC [Idiomarina sp.]
MNWRIVGIIVLLFGVGLLLVLRPFSDDGEEGAATATKLMQPDFTAYGLETKIFESDGALAHQIRSEEMAHYNQIGLTELKQPKYSVFSQDGTETWQVSAEQGTFYDDKTLILERSVEILALQESSPIQRIMTEYLVIDLANESMSTEYPVLMRGPQVVVRGDGLSADMSAEIMELKRHVKTVFQPKS